ncbi:type II toxin-antitoxin system RelE/ParE family toxin [Terracidiphilus sp.]|jgi:toxin ParE1/3/4|uniref:type II toxin-antitoxin system RelE/ParE family toxin n=1 Tax=Terracidiphilus sp. TaxID=1964191 RepID=UPI003C1A89F4
MTHYEPLQIHYSIAADADLSEIWSYVAENSSESLAYEFNARIHSKIQQAARFPFSGAPRLHLAPGMRVLFQEQYAIYCIPGAGEITILRVPHGARDLTAIVEEGDFVL